MDQAIADRARVLVDQLKNGAAVIKTPAEKASEKESQDRIRYMAMFLGRLGIGSNSNEFLSALAMVTGGVIGQAPDLKSLNQVLSQHSNHVRHVAQQHSQVREKMKEQSNASVPIPQG